MAAPLEILGSQKRLCDGLTRRQMLTVSGLGLMGPGLADLASLQAAPDGGGASAHPHFGRAKSVILLFLYGAVSQIETFDPKPDAPIEVRGKLGSIPTCIPGCRLGEGLSNMSRMIDRATVIRSMTHPYPIHGTAYSVTSTPTLVQSMQDNPKDRRHWPFIGSVVDYLDRKRESAAAGQAADVIAHGLVPRNIGIPFLHSSRRRYPIINAGPYGAFLGPSYDPLWTEFKGEALHSQKYHFGTDITTVVDPYGGVKDGCRFRFGQNATLQPTMTLDRLNRRRTLLEQFDQARRDLDAHPKIKAFGSTQRLAFSTLHNRQLGHALDIARESRKVRRNYGMTLFGQSCLLARRLIEAGGRFVTVFWDEFGSANSAWDTHYWHYPRMTEQLLPGLDHAYPALILDLERRGLLDETLVICTTEHGRTPKLDPGGDHPSGRGQGGRGHWSRAYSTVLAGAGIARGKIVGRTDRLAGEVARTPVSPKDILATAYHLLGIDPHTLIKDRSGRPFPVGGVGRVLGEVLA